ncbi:hypothetical protein LGMK_00810 [Leuconostoc sp. C2]|nr:hypothetical protein LGMK_00810 [Leuconostoc sp. C2]
MQRFYRQFHMKWWRIIVWAYLIGLLVYGIYIILISLPR